MSSTKKTNVKSKNKVRRSKNASTLSPTAEMLVSVAKVIVFSLSAAFIFMLIGAYFAFGSTDPSSAIVPISLSALYLSSILCGFLSTRLMKGAKFIGGSLSCFAFIMLIMVVSLFLGVVKQGFTPGIRALLFLLIIPAVYFGVFLGNIKAQKKRKSPYKKRRR